MAGVIPSFMIEGNDPSFSFCERAVQTDERNAIALTFLSLKYVTPVLEMQSTDPHTAAAERCSYFIRSQTSVLMLSLPLIGLTIVGDLIVRRLSLTSMKRC